MSFLDDKIKSFQAAWKQLTLIGTWIGTVAGSFLLPLPDWGSDSQHISKTRFILFIATVLAGFMLVLTNKYKHPKGWLLIAGITFLLFVASFILYNVSRENNTRAYYGTSKVIGRITNPDYVKGCKERGIDPADKDILKYAGGDSDNLWPKDEIQHNRNMLIALLTLAYCLLTVFMISFIHAILLNTITDATPKT